MNTPPIPQKRRVFFYVDGFNLYHRKLKSAPALKWLDLHKLISKFIFPNDTIAAIRYFTAQVDPDNAGSPKRARQQHYCDALRALRIGVVEGRFEKRPRKCKVDASVCSLGAEYEDWTEKMSDVNLAIQIVADFLKQKPDVICVLSADTDVIPALKMVRKEASEMKHKVKIVVILPTKDKSQYYSRLENFGGVAEIIQIEDEWLQKSALPSPLTENNVTFTRPASWC